MATGRDLDILVIGELNPDVIVSDPDPAPTFGEVERVVESIHLTVGSSSAIFACGAARLELDVAFFGVVGDDAFGRFMLEALRVRGVEVSSVIVDRRLPTGATVILSSGRDRAILTALGTISAMDVDLVPAGLLGRARHIHSGSFYMQDTSRSRMPAFFAAARARGITTSFDTNWDPTGVWDGGVHDMLRASDVFFPNAAEARLISGIADVEEAARALARIGAEGRTDGGPIIAVKLGAEGALGCSSDCRIIRVPAQPADPIDTTGAGDSFNAGFLRAWLDGADLAASLRYGAACGALSTRALGGVDSQPTRGEVAAALASTARTATDGQG